MTAEEKRNRFWKRLIIVLVLWLVVLPLGILGIFAVVGYHGSAKRPETAQKVRVPELKGLQVEQAQAAAQKAGFPFEVGGKDFDSDQKPGTVLVQEPWPGEAWPRNTTISVLIAAEAPDAKFWQEQRRKLAEYERQGYFKTKDEKKR